MTALKTLFIVLAALESANLFGFATSPQQQWFRPAFVLRGGSSSSQSDLPTQQQEKEEEYGRLSDDYFRLTPDQIAHFRREGCVTIDNVLTEKEVDELQDLFDKFVSGEIHVPGKDFCDMSKPFGTPYEEWSIVNCMLPTKYHPEMRGNIFERLTASIVQQLFDDTDMVKDYDQLLNKRPGKDDAVFAWHQDMAYWPGPGALGVDRTETATFSLAIDNSDPENGCLRYIAGSGASKTLRPHRPLAGTREEGHALCAEVDESKDEITLAPAKRGSLTIHDEYVVHGSGGNICEDRQRRTYVLAYRTKETVEAERKIGFDHSHNNDDVNWDTFQDGESHRVKSSSNPGSGGDSSDSA